MALPVIAIGTLARFLLQKGGMELAKQFAKKKGLRITQTAVNAAKKANKSKAVKEVVKKTTKKMQVVKNKVNPKTKAANKKTTTQKKTTTKKDSFDEQLKKKEGTKKFNKTNKESTKSTTKTDSGGLKEVQKKYNFDPKKLAAGKNDKRVNRKTTTKKTTTKKQEEKKPIGNKEDLQKGLRNSKIATGVALGASSLGLPFLLNNKKSNKTTTKASGPSSFGQAFREARKEKGTDAIFTYKGKQYSTVTMDEVKKAGFNTLREYLNAKKKKSTSSAPGK